MPRVRFTRNIQLKNKAVGLPGAPIMGDGDEMELTAQQVEALREISPNAFVVIDAPKKAKKEKE